MRLLGQTAVAVVALTFVAGACGEDTRDDGPPEFHAVYKILTFPETGPVLEIRSLDYDSPSRWRLTTIERSDSRDKDGSWVEAADDVLTYNDGRTAKISSDENWIPGEVWAPPVISRSELEGGDWIRNGDVYELRVTYALECPDYESLECRGGVDSVQQRELEVRNADGILLEHREYADERLIRFTTIANLAYE